MILSSPRKSQHNSQVETTIDYNPRLVTSQPKMIVCGVMIWSDLFVCQPNTSRKYEAYLSGFLRYLLEIKLLEFLFVHLGKQMTERFRKP